MGDLGWYKIIVQIAKILGGPKIFILVTMLIGYIVCRGCENGIKFATNKIKKMQKKQFM